MSCSYPSQKPQVVSVVAVLFLVLAGQSLIAQTAWLPIPPEDLALKDNPALPGSSAMILYKEDTLDHKKNAREVYYRIKIFTDEGRKYANIEIPYLQGKQNVKDLAARTVQPDGRILEFRGTVFDKTVLAVRKLNFQAKTFTLPEVQPGSLIEYHYRLEGGGREGVWIVQEPLFVRQVRLTLRPFGSLTPSFTRRPDSFGEEFFRSADGTWWTTLLNLPPLEAEVLMPPERQLQMRYHISYGAYMLTPGTFWERTGEELAKSSNNFIGKADNFRAVVQQLVSVQDPADTKLKKLYGAVQTRIRNLSYEESYSKKERKTENLKERRSAQDVWNYGYGSGREINFLFVSLCRAAGFTADPVFVSDRGSHFFDEEILDESQLDADIVVVDLPDGPRYFDPAARFAPFGQLPWYEQGVSGFRVSGNVSGKITTPEPRAEENIRQRRTTMELQPDGAAQVSTEIRYSGQAAIERRNDLFELTDNQREQRLREEFEEDFPAANLKEVAWKGLDDASENVQVTFSFDLPDYAVVLGQRLLVRPALLPARTPLPNWKRKYSVYFPYPYTRIDDVRIVPPAGFQQEQIPAEEKVTMPFGQFELKATSEGGAISLQRKLVLQGYFFRESAIYRQLKNFFDTVQARDQLHFVFRRP